MFNSRYVLGVDPGETTGIVRLQYYPRSTPEHRVPVWTRTGEPMAIQCNHQSVPEILAWLTAMGDILISHERFVVGLRASRSKKAGASQITRDINGHIDTLHKTDQPNRRIRVVEHSASETKVWATDERLRAAGIELPPEMRHARDAARQACFAACHDLGAPDPLSKLARLMAAYSGGGVYPLALAAEVTAATGTERRDHINGDPVTDAVIGTDTRPLASMTITGTSPTGRLHRSPLPPPHEVIRRVIDSQAADEARYIGIERQIEEWTT
jgi:hypothetical protein